MEVLAASRNSMLTTGKVCENCGRVEIWERRGFRGGIGSRRWGKRCALRLIWMKLRLTQIISSAANIFFAITSSAIRVGLGIEVKGTKDFDIWS